MIYQLVNSKKQKHNKTKQKQTPPPSHQETKQKVTMKTYSFPFSSKTLGYS
jgi:hypothetical protein